MSEALRQVFAELGFKIDTEKLDAMEKRLKEVIKTTEKLPGAAAVTTKKTKKANDDSAKAAEEAARKTRKAADDTAKAANDEAQAVEAGAERERKAREAAQPKKVKNFGELVEHGKDKVFGGIGDQLTKSFPALDTFKDKLGIDSAALGKVFVGASAAAVGAIAGVTAALFSFANGFAASSEQLRDVSANAGVTISEFQSLAHAGTQSGVGADRLTGAMQSLHQQMQAGRLSGGGINWTLRRMGVETRTAGRGIRSASDVMNDLASSFDRIQNPIRKDRMGVRLFGQDWYRLRDVMHGGEGGIAALRAEMDALGGGTLPEAVTASRHYTQATERLGVAQDSLRSVLAVGILPALTWVTNKAALLTGWWSRMTRGTNVVQIGLTALAAAGVAAAGALLIAWFPVLLPFLKVAAAVAVLVLILDDLITFVNGGNSVIGELIDKLFGVGTAAEYVQDLHVVWREIVDDVNEAIAAVKEFIALRPGGGNTDRGAIRSPIRRPGAAGAPGGRPGARPGSAGAPGSAGRGTARAPAPSAAFAAALAPVPGTAQGTAPYLAPIPLTRTVAAPGGGGGRTVVHQSTHQTHINFQLHGTDPHAQAQEVMRLIEQTERNRRDADHPAPGDDD